MQVRTMYFMYPSSCSSFSEKKREQGIERRREIARKEGRGEGGSEGREREKDIQRGEGEREREGGRGEREKEIGGRGERERERGGRKGGKERERKGGRERRERGEGRKERERETSASGHVAFFPFPSFFSVGLFVLMRFMGSCGEVCIPAEVCLTGDGSRCSVRASISTCPVWHRCRPVYLAA